LLVCVQDFESGSSNIEAAAAVSGEFRKSLEVHCNSSFKDMIGGGGGFPRSASTNTLSTVASGTQLSGAGSSSNLRGLAGVASHTVQHSQFDDTSDANVQAIHRTLSQLALSQQQQDMSLNAGLGTAQQDSYDSLVEMEKNFDRWGLSRALFRRASVLSQTMLKLQSDREGQC
jgi:hypothetical protein